jgi:hypothetical protein
MALLALFAEFRVKQHGHPMNRRILQIVTGVLAIIPVVTGIIGMWGLNDPIYASTALTANTLLDSNLRFFWWRVARIGPRFVLAHSRNRETNRLVPSYLGHDFSRWRRPVHFHAICRTTAYPVRWLRNP